MYISREEQFYDAVVKGDLKEVISIVETGSKNPKEDNSYGLLIAANYGHNEIIKYLIPISDPKSRHSLALRKCVNDCNLIGVEMLAPVSHQSTCTDLFRGAVSMREKGIARLLLDYVDINKVIDLI